MSSDETHVEVRKYRQPVFADFMDEVYLAMPPATKNALPTNVGDYVDRLVSFALADLAAYGALLARTIRDVYVHSPDGERFIRDPERSRSVVETMLFLDDNGDIVSVRNPVLDWVKNAKTGQSTLMFKDYQSYEILTGAQIGQRFTKHSRPLALELAVPPTSETS